MQEADHCLCFRRGDPVSHFPNLAAYYQMYRDVATARGLMLIDHHPNWVALQANDPTTFQSYIADGVHPNAEGIGEITFPLLQWKLSGGLPLPTGGAR